MDDFDLSITYNKVLQFILDYEKMPFSFFNNFEERITYEEYGLGGTFLPRGYYCPSLILDIISGNVSRGKIQKKKPKERVSDFTFCFDCENKLILVKRIDSFEYVIHQNQFEIGICFSNDMKIETISYCQFDDQKILSYVWCLYNPYEKKIVELIEEKYKYLEKEVCVDWFRLIPIKNRKVQQHNQYVFSIENGYFSSYTVQEFDENQLRKKFLENRVFKVMAKRKLDSNLIFKKRSEQNSSMEQIEHKCK